jgi:O-methyltransferase
MSLVRYYGRLARQSGFSIAKGVALPFVRGEAVRSGAHEMAYPV